MKELIKPIEEFFLATLLKVTFVGVLIVILVDIFFNGFAFSKILAVDLVVLSAVTCSFVFYKKKMFSVSVVIMGSVTMVAMLYQGFTADTITTTSMAVILVIGFAYSLMLKGTVRIVMHTIAASGMASLFIWQTLHPQNYGQSDASNVISMGITYSILYFVITYSSVLLKQRYDNTYRDLAFSNRELIEKTNEIETQNEELLQSQENLSELNSHLEQLVEERSQKIIQQNEQLIKYAYSNAHHVRGPVARVLGLIQLSRLETHLDYPFLFSKIEEQTKEIDEVVKGINRELETENLKEYLRNPSEIR